MASWLADYARKNGYVDEKTAGRAKTTAWAVGKDLKYQYENGRDNSWTSSVKANAANIAVKPGTAIANRYVDGSGELYQKAREVARLLGKAQKQGWSKESLLKVFEVLKLMPAIAKRIAKATGIDTHELILQALSAAGIPTNMSSMLMKAFLAGAITPESMLAQFVTFPPTLLSTFQAVDFANIVSSPQEAFTSAITSHLANENLPSTQDIASYIPANISGYLPNDESITNLSPSLSEYIPSNETFTNLASNYLPSPLSSTQNIKAQTETLQHIAHEEEKIFETFDKATKSAEKIINIASEKVIKLSKHIDKDIAATNKPIELQKEKSDNTIMIEKLRRMQLSLATHAKPNQTSVQVSVAQRKPQPVFRQRPQRKPTSTTRQHTLPVVVEPVHSMSKEEISIYRSLEDSDADDTDYSDDSDDDYSDDDSDDSYSDSDSDSDDSD
jgi:hypothetical protein